MFTAVNHQDKQVIVSYKGTSRKTDFIHDADLGFRSLSDGDYYRESEAIRAFFGALNIPHRFNTAKNFA